MAKNKKLYPKTRWHRILAGILEEWLTPAGILVQSDVPIGAEPPKADILLLKSTAGNMQRRQRQRLADGLRDSRAPHLLLEFKYTESLNENRLPEQTLRLEQMFNGLYRLLSDEGEEMKTHAKTDELTVEYVLETGKEWIDHVLSLMPIKERIKGIKRKELLKELGPKKLLKELGPKEFLKILGPEELLKELGPEELLKQLKPAELAILKERLKNL